MANQFKNVAVLMGGTSSERKVSLISGGAIVMGLTDAGYNVTPVTLDVDSIETVLPANADVVFIALHGGYGENGGIQADLDKKGIPYTGSGSAASRLAMDKIACKGVFGDAKLSVPEYEVLGLGQVMTSLSLPLVVKPPCDGSSVGVFKVEENKDWGIALRKARRMDRQGLVLVEKYVEGREWTVSVLNGEALPVIEIQAPEGWYGYQAKYTAGMTQYVFPDESDLTKKVQKAAVEAYKAVGCRGAARVDFRVTEDGGLYVLEVNTIPGFTPTSLLPKAALSAGISFTELCEKIISKAVFDKVIA